MSEEVHRHAARLDSMSEVELLELMNDEDGNAIAAVRAQIPSLAHAIDQIAGRIKNGGRLHYFGSGTSGRLATLDAAECAPTFGVDPQLVIAHAAADGEAEDDRDLGVSDARSAGLTTRDTLVAVSASGSTAYVLGAVEHGRTSGVLIVAVTCAPGSMLGRVADIAIEVAVGPEVIAGSTRLKAGTAQKVALNMLSTGVFTRLGHTYRGRMVGVTAANAKQRGRALRLVVDVTGAGETPASDALAQAHGNAKIAVLMLRCRLSTVDAEARLSAARGDLAAALGERRHA